MKNFSSILLTKAGPYCGYSLEEIIQIKTTEEKKIGKFFWGYSGVFCHPKRIQPSLHLFPKLLFSITRSNFSTQTISRFTHYSKDKLNWQPLPPEVLLVGNSQKAHFAFVAKNLQSANFKLSLSDYQVSSGQTLDQYFRYRVDKAFACYHPSTNQDKTLQISYIADLLDCVFIR